MLVHHGGGNRPTADYARPSGPLEARDGENSRSRAQLGAAGTIISRLRKAKTEIPENLQ